MHIRFSTVVITVLMIIDIFLVVHIRSLTEQVNTLATKTAVSIDDAREQMPTDSTDFVWGDLFGAYTYAQFGAWLAPEDASGKRIRSPLTLNVFLSSKTECPSLISEMEVLRRLDPVLKKRGQRMIAICDADDSLGVTEILNKEELRIPVIPLAFDDSVTTISFLGISPFSMPFKVIYDSTFSAIYVRGADNTPESQADFERAVLRLSSLIERGEL